MPVTDLLTLAALFGAVLLLTPFLGRYMARVLEGERTLLSPAPGARRARHLPRGGHRPRPRAGLAVATPSASSCSAPVSIAWLYLVQRLQAGLPLNPTGAAAVPEDLAFNTAVSFVTNTNWQNYSGEIAMAHLTQAAGPGRAELRLRRGRHRGRDRAGPRARPPAVAARSATSGRT